MTFNFTRHTDGPGNTIFAADVNNVQIAVEALDFIDISDDFAGLPTTGQVVFRHVFLGPMSFPDTPIASIVGLTVGTVAAIYTIKKVSHGITTTIGTASIAIGQTVAEFSLASTSFDRDDVLTVTAPATVTGTPSNLVIGFRFLPFRSAALPAPDFSTMTGRVGHWSADVGVTANTSGEVSQVNDQSGGAMHGTQSTTAAKPHLVINTLNGQPVLRFDGGDSLALPSGFASWTGKTVYAVAMNSLASPGADNRLFELGNAGADLIMMRVASGTNTAQWCERIGIGSFEAAGNANGWAQNQYRINVYAQEPTTALGQLLTDDKLVQSVDISAPTTSVTRPNNVIGRDNNATAFWTGDLCELIICNVMHSLTERQKWTAALAAKWGINIAPVITVPAKPTIAVPSDFFGIHLNHLLDTSNGADTVFPGAGYFGRFRFGALGTFWEQIETANGTYVWTAMDAYMAQVTGKSLNFVINATPTWASADPTDARTGHHAFAAGDLAEPSNMAFLTAFINALLDRYPTRFSAFEIWNEPNHATLGFTGTTASLVSIAQTVWNAAKAREPGIKIISPSYSYQVGSAGSAETGFDAYLAAGGGQYTDAIGWHLYADMKQPEYKVYYRRAIRNIARKYGLGALPFQDTEDTWDFHTTNYTAAEKQGYPSRMAILGWAYGDDVCLSYSYDVRNTFMDWTSGADSSTLTSSGLAWKTTYGWLVGKKMIDFSGIGTVYTAALDDGSHIVWDANTNGSTFTIPPAWGATQTTDLANSSTSLGGATTKAITVAPIKFS